MKRIVGIELTNHCNRRCVYCGIPTMTRPKGYMSQETFTRCVEIVKSLGQPSVIPTFYGEALLHPKFFDYTKQLNDGGIKIQMITNGDFLTDEVIGKLSSLDYEYFLISGHIGQAKGEELVTKCKEAGIHMARFQYELMDILVDLNCEKPVPEEAIGRCIFLKKDLAIILWNGDITVCCEDYEGKGVFANVAGLDVLTSNPKPFSLCKTCPRYWAFQP